LKGLDFFRTSVTGTLFKGHILGHRTTQLTGHQNSTILNFIGARMIGVMVTSGATRHTVLHSNRHHQRSSTQPFTGPVMGTSYIKSCS